MLDFCDRPYQYSAPAPTPGWIRLFKWYNKRFILPGAEHRIKGVTLANPELLRDRLAAPARHVLFLPNHSTHSDPQIMFEVFRQLGINSMFMAGYDIFLRSRLRAWIMRRSGAFSVDREGSDKRAMKQAIRTLVEGPYALTIFPEGNVYFMNDSVTPFHDGAAYIGLKAQHALLARTEPESMHVVPVSIKVTHRTDQRETIADMLAEAGRIAETTLDRSRAPVEELIRIGGEILKRNLRERHYLAGDAQATDVTQMTEDAARAIVERLEQTMGLQPRDENTLADRILMVRRKIHKIRIDPDQAAQHDAAATWADDAILAFRILGYAVPYVAEQPTMDRYGEAVERLVEDLSTKAVPPYGDRHAFVRLGAPIDLRTYCDTTGRRNRAAVHELTAAAQRAVQDGLDRLNAENPHPGAQPYRDAT